MDNNNNSLSSGVKGLQFNYSIAFVILQTAQIILSSEFYADNDAKCLHTT